MVVGEVEVLLTHTRQEQPEPVVGVVVVQLATTTTPPHQVPTREERDMLDKEIVEGIRAMPTTQVVVVVLEQLAEMETIKPMVVLGYSIQ